MGYLYMFPLFWNNDINIINNTNSRNFDQFGIAILPGRFTRLINQVAVFIPICKDVIIPLMNHEFIFTGIVQNRIVSDLFSFIQKLGYRLSG